MRYKPRSKKTGMFPYEAEIYKDRPRKRGVKYEYEVTKLPYLVTRHYSPDFTVTLPSGRVLHIEVKGYLRSADKSKMRAAKKQNPTADIRFIFPRLVEKNTKWCQKFGFPFAIGAIPDEWIDDKEAPDHG